MEILLFVVFAFLIINLHFTVRMIREMKALNREIDILQKESNVDNSNILTELFNVNDTIKIFDKALYTSAHNQLQVCVDTNSRIGEIKNKLETTPFVEVRETKTKSKK